MFDEIYKVPLFVGLEMFAELNWILMKTRIMVIFFIMVLGWKVGINSAKIEHYNVLTDN